MAHWHGTAARPLLAALIALALGCALAAAAPARAFAAGEEATPDIAAAAEATAAPEPAAIEPIGVRYSISTAKGAWSPEKSNYAIAGKARGGARLRSLEVAVGTGQLTGGVKYRARLASGKWTAWKSNGKPLASHGNVEAVQVKLTGQIAQTHDVVYRAYVDTVGWQRRMRNGESAGVEGRNLRIEALRIKLVKKTKQAGWVQRDGAWSYYKAGKPQVSRWLDTKESPIDTALAGSHRYWLDGNGELAVSRYVLPSSPLDAKASYAAFATEAGYLFCGKRSSYEGITLSKSNGKLYAKTQWLKTSAFDGAPQRYRMTNVGDYAVAKTGLFKVDGKKYYGFEDGRGYVMRSTTKWVAGSWYKADSAGALAGANKKTKQHIERYVKWAIGIANDNSHGYTQAFDGRWGPDYDCSSFVASSLLAAGFPDSGATWTGNMKELLTSIGFVWHTDLSQLKRGDIMLVHNDRRQHTEIFIGKNKLVGAHIAETGGIYGVTGDQTGNEISVTKYYDAPWEGFLRYRS